MSMMRAFTVGRIDGNWTRQITDFDHTALGDDGILVKVAYSGINFKDGLASSEKGRVARIDPLIPGVDLAGEVVESNDPSVAVGSQVIVHGYDIGVAHHGGYAPFARAKAEWVVPMPAGLDARTAMLVGTAGYTAALSVDALERNGLTPGDGPVLVTGATGGVGTRGPGETKIETDRRRINASMARLRREIKEMKTARDTQRRDRKRHGVPSVVIAGYTNAGKSSLLNRITGAGVLVEDALFATLDPTVRKAVTPHGRDMTVTDTVGFVRHLPHQLVEAFRSTLEEVNDADLIVPDSRRGWSRLVHAVLKSYFYTGKSFSYSTLLIREFGAPLKTFGGTASGPGALIDGVADICKVMENREGKKLRSIDVLDIANIIGRIVVSGSSRRSAQIAIGDPDDVLRPPLAQRVEAPVVAAPPPGTPRTSIPRSRCPHGSSSAVAASCTPST